MIVFSVLYFGLTAATDDDYVPSIMLGLLIVCLSIFWIKYVNNNSIITINILSRIKVKKA